MNCRMLYIKWRVVSLLLSIILVLAVMLAALMSYHTHPVAVEAFDNLSPRFVNTTVKQSRLQQGNIRQNKSITKWAAKPGIPTPPPLRTIMYMEGWIHSEEFYNGEFSLYLDAYSKDICGYLCFAVKIGETRFASADIVVFQPSTLKLDPPRKHPHQYWILHSFADLSAKEQKYLHVNGYVDLIDQYMLRPREVNTPMLFSKAFNLIPDGGFDDDLRIMKYFGRHPAFSIGQVISTCELLPESAYESQLDNPLGVRLKGQSPDASLRYLTMCFEVESSLQLPVDMTFVVLDDGDCITSLAEQLLQVLASDRDAIPVIPAVAELTLMELTSISPPHSFVAFNEFDNVGGLAMHLKKILEDSQLFLSYHNWKSTYTLDTRAGSDPVRSAICKFCQLGYIRPAANPQAITQNCSRLMDE